MRSETHLNRVNKANKDFSEYINNKDSDLKHKYDRREQMMQSLD